MFTFSKLTWDKLQINEREFVYEGNLFDIHSTEDLGNQIAIEAIRDVSENRLNESLADAMENSTESTSSTSLILFSLLSDRVLSQEMSLRSVNDFNCGVLLSSELIPSSQIFHPIIFSPPDFMKG